MKKLSLLIFVGLMLSASQLFAQTNIPAGPAYDNINHDRSQREAIPTRYKTDRKHALIFTGNNAQLVKMSRNEYMKLNGTAIYTIESPILQVSVPKAEFNNNIFVPHSPAFFKKS